MTDASDQVLAGFDLDARIRLLSGRDAWHLEPVGDLPAWTLTDGPHGVRAKVDDGGDLAIADVRAATCFPPAVTLACTWDATLIADVGHALGREAAAHDVGVLLGPGLNLVRHPAGGRTFEYLGEDPLLAGRLAAALIRGIQAEGVGACAKHLAANHQETARMTVDTVVDERTLHELELAAFEIAVTEGRPWTVMHSYNRLNGRHTGEDPWLLGEVLRGRWGFDGLVVTDWGAVADRVAGIAAGTDLEMPGGAKLWDREVREAVMAGTLDERAVDACAGRVVTLSQRLADAAPARATARRAHDPDDHHELARRAAVAGTVLLTERGGLPLAPDADVALLGAFARDPRYQGAGSSRVRPTRLDRLADELPARHRGRVTTADGYDLVDGSADDAQIDEAIAAARDADVAVVCVGLPDAHESEGLDRPDLRLPAGHRRLVDAVLATGTPTVLVVSAGGPVELPWADQAAAILATHLGGQAGGSATCDVLLGDADPGGRLACSYPVRVEDLPADATFGDTRQVEHREGLAVGYRFHDTAGAPAAFPFGHGRSLTTFSHEAVRTTGQAPDDLAVQLTVTNTGSRAGSEVVQVYVAAQDPPVPRPAQELAGWSKVHLAPGERAHLTISLDRRAFAVWDVDSGRWAVPEGRYELRIARSTVDVVARRQIEVEPGDPVGPSATPVAGAADDATFAAALGGPAPVPAPARPFHRDSTVDDLAASRRGRLVRRVLLAVARRQAASLAGDDPTSRRMFEATFAQLPLRTVAMFSDGRVTLAHVDRLLRWLNGRRVELTPPAADRAP